MWYKTDRGDYIKLPLQPKDNKIKLIFGEEANHLMLYPMQKWEFDEPLLSMMQQLREYLEKAVTVIVVGYSFRDPYMVKIFHDAARKNRHLKIILIDPKARQIYQEKLLYFLGEDKVSIIPSSLADRVLCLQYEFEKIISILDEYTNNLRRGWGTEIECEEKSYAGENQEWFKNGPMMYYVNSEFIDREDSSSIAKGIKRTFEKGRSDEMKDACLSLVQQYKIENRINRIFNLVEKNN